MTLDVIASRAIRSISQYHKIKRRLYYRSGPPKLVAQRRALFYKTVWEEAAAAAGATLRTLDGSACEIRRGEVRLRVRNNVTSLDDPLTVALAEDKALVYGLLTERDIPIPRYAVCSSDDLGRAWSFVKAVRNPVVVKPAHGTAGAVGVTTAIAKKHRLARAMAYAGAFGREIIVEEHVGEGIYRLLFFDDELIDAVLRHPPTVRGDGRSTIEQLIARENEDRMQKGIEACQSLVKIDMELRHTLLNAGYTLRSVPSRDALVRLKNAVNDNRREDNESATERLCPAVVEAGRQAVVAVGARLAGVDVITRDPSVSLADSSGVIIEVNATPGLYYHYMKRDGSVPVASLVLQRLVARQARRPADST